MRKNHPKPWAYWGLLWLSIIFTHVFIHEASGQTICQGNITLSSQAQVDAFACSELSNGNLTISGPNIQNLSPLSVLESLDGDLTIEGNPLLSSLQGLENLSKLSQLQVRDNPLLMDLKGLDGLKECEFLVIQDCASLKTLAGLENLTRVDFLFEINNNDQLVNLDFLPRLNPENQFRDRKAHV
ncbi:MAG: hypothetical protein AAFU64_10165 [Bacteroidota bacterium]